MRRLTAVLALTLVACTTPGSTSLPTPTAAVSPEAAQAVDVDGRFQLTFTLSRTTWRSDEAIEGEARLALTEGTETQVYGSGGGVTAFDFREMGGDKHVEPVRPADRAQHELPFGP